eukprot:SAG11_NODE_1564_length_4675_cov_2.781687_4_plen_53_part_00
MRFLFLCGVAQVPPEVRVKKLRALRKKMRQIDDLEAKCVQPDEKPAFEGVAC